MEKFLEHNIEIIIEKFLFQFNSQKNREHLKNHLNEIPFNDFIFEDKTKDNLVEKGCVLLKGINPQKCIIYLLISPN